MRTALWILVAHLAVVTGLAIYLGVRVFVCFDALDTWRTPQPIVRQISR